MRLIDADEFFKDFTELEPYEHISHEYNIDAVEVVRCGKCNLRYKPLDDDERNEVFCLFMNCTMMKDDFCSRGRTDGEEKNNEQTI